MMMKAFDSIAKAEKFAAEQRAKVVVQYNWNPWTQMIEKTYVVKF